MQIGEELCDRYLKGDYQYVLAVHNDKSHIHCHIIFNNTNLYNGLSFTTEHNQGRTNERAWAELRQRSDELCKEYGLSVIGEPEKEHGVSHFEREHQKAGTSWKDKLRNMLTEIISYSRSFEDFLKNCTDSGIEYVYTPHNKVKLKFKLSGEGQQRFTRADTLGDEFELSAITETIETAQKKAAAKEAMEKFLASRRERKQAEIALLNRATAKPAEPTPTPTAPTKPTESKAPEKKEDVWAGIRGMRDSDKMIADLESVGIKSFKEFSGFMWNSQHSDDHTEELSLLKKKITAIDKLIAMMKQRSDNSSKYKEYQECLAFSKKRFRKKNVVSIDAYEEADKYINAHINDYFISGRAPKRSDLEQILIELKSKYNALVPEHNAFLRRKAAASQYTRQIRTYLQRQHQQEYERQHNERKRSQQKKKDVLE